MLVFKYIVNGLSDFFLVFVMVEDFDKDVFLVLEKGLLRVFEVVLNDFIMFLVWFFFGFDLFKVFSG